MRILILSLFVIFLSSCSTQRFLFSRSVPIESSNESDNMQLFFVGGLGQTKNIKAKRICQNDQNSKVAAIEFKNSALDVIISALTGNIITPTTANVYCNN